MRVEDVESMSRILVVLGPSGFYFLNPHRKSGSCSEVQSRLRLV